MTQSLRVGAFSAAAGGWSKDYIRLFTRDVLNMLSKREIDTPTKEYQTLNQITYGKNEYVFSTPVIATIEKNEDGYFLQAKELELDLFAETKPELNELLGESVECLWNTFLRRPDADFDESGVDFKRRLEKLVRLN